MNKKKILLFTGIICFVGLFPIRVNAEKICKMEIEKKDGNFEHTTGITISKSGSVTMAAAGGGFVNEPIYQDQNGNPMFCAAASLRHNGGSGVYNNDLAYQQTQTGQANFNLSKCTNSNDNDGMCGYGAIAQMASALNKGIEMGGLNNSDYGDLNQSQIIAAAQNAIRYMDASRSDESYRNQGSGDRANNVYNTLNSINNNTYKGDSSYCGSSCSGDTAKAVYSLSIDMYVAAMNGVDMSGSSVTVLYDKASGSKQPFWTSEDISEIEKCEDEDEPDEPTLSCPLTPSGGAGGCDGGEAKDPEMCSILATTSSSSSSVMQTRMEAKYTYMGSGSSTRAGGYFQHNVSGMSGSGLSTKVELTKQGTCIIDYEAWKQKYLEANKAVAAAWSEMTNWWSIYVNNPSPREEENGDVCGGCQSNVCAYKNGKIYYWENSSPHTHCNPSEYSPNCFGDGGHAPVSDGNRGNVQDYLVPDTDRNKACEANNKKNGTKNPCNFQTCGTSSVISQADPGDRDYVRRQMEGTTTAYIGALDARAKLLEDLQNCFFMQSPTWYKGGSYSTALGSHSTSVNMSYYGEVMNLNIPSGGFNLDYEHNGKNIGENWSIFAATSTAGPSEDGIQHDEAKKEVICGGSCSGNMDELGGAGEEPLPFFFCSGGYTGTCITRQITVSKASTSTMKAKAEIGVYQGASFSTRIYTGQIVNGNGGVGYLSLPDRSWPVPATVKSGVYSSFSTVPDIPTGFGVLPGGTVVCPYNVTNELTVYDCDYDYHVCYDCTGSEECYPDNEDNISLGVYFRSIDLNDVFPGSQYSPQNQNSLTGVTRRIGSNWTTNNAVQVIGEIQKLNEQIWFETPQYTVTLSPEARRRIKKYNSNNKYLDYSMNCEGFNCSSKFLDTELRELLGDKYSEYFTKDKTIPNSALYNYNR